MATVRELLLKFGVKADQKKVEAFDKAVEGAKSNMLGVGKIAAAAGAAILGFGAGLFAIAAHTAAAGDAAAKAAGRLGITAEAYQTLSHAASMSGATAQDLEAALRKQAITAQDAAAGTGAAAEAYAALGLSGAQVKEMSKDSAALFRELATRISGVDDQAKKISLVNDIFGKGGSALIPMLNEGGAGIAELEAQAISLGFVLSNDAAKAGEAFGDRLSEVQGIVIGLKNILGAALIPVLTEGMEAIRDWYLANGRFIRQRIDAYAKRIENGVRSLVRRLKEADDFVRRRLGGWERIFQAIALGVAVVVAGIASLKVLVTAAAMFNTFTATVSLANAALAAFAGLLGVGVGAAAGIFLLLFGAVIATIASVGAVATGAALAFEDWLVYIRGGDSALGTLIGRLKASGGAAGALGRVIEAVAQALRAFWGVLQDTGSAGLRVGGILADALGGAVLDAINWLLEKLGLVDVSFGSLGEVALDGLEKSLNVIAGLIETMTGGAEKLSEMLFNAFGNARNLGDLKLGAKFFVGEQAGNVAGVAREAAGGIAKNVAKPAAGLAVGAGRYLGNNARAFLPGASPAPASGKVDNRRTEIANNTTINVPPGTPTEMVDRIRAEMDRLLSQTAQSFAGGEV